MACQAALPVIRADRSAIFPRSSDSAIGLSGGNIMQFCASSSASARSPLSRARVLCASAPVRFFLSWSPDPPSQIFGLPQSPPSVRASELLSLECDLF
ncbi:hypothetical protein DOTSEDRAFT_73585 [Dothistroma septosporum NZE10]|uniref:Uncharacterized protein n=1 Tax=Dothistroma septosporum (strain NZE10 / CBS 128990) TaxID=675120 RepID=N1PI66_DOTSN|nr:hypothetical protein DOTSEDRAFT_73585 [Dothistroma septosporum NZE10]